MISWKDAITVIGFVLLTIAINFVVASLCWLIICWLINIPFYWNWAAAFFVFCEGVNGIKLTLNK